MINIFFHFFSQIDDYTTLPNSPARTYSIRLYIPLVDILLPCISPGLPFSIFSSLNLCASLFENKMTILIEQPVLGMILYH